MYYIFPFSKVKLGARIVLYGAGVAGQNYLQQVRDLNFCEVVCMIDKNWKQKHISNMQVIPLDRLSEFEFDYIVITLVREDLQRIIRKELLDLGVSENKIIAHPPKQMEWVRPDVGWNNQKEEYEWGMKLGDYLKKIDPHLLVTSDRIDVVIRYLLFRDFVWKINNKAHISLFSRYTLVRTGGVEAPSYFSGGGKNSVYEFLEQGKRLCESMEHEGFKPESFIPLGHNFKAYDGLHRIAAALATKKDIWVRNYDDRAASDVTLDYLKEQGFLFTDLLRVLRGFVDIYPGNCGMFVFFAPSMNLWHYMEGQIKSRFKIVGSLDFDFQTNYIAFNNVLRLLYNDTNRYSEWLTRKLDMLSVAPLIYRIVVVSDEHGKYEDFYKEIRQFKLNLRQSLFVDIDEHIPVTIHASDSNDEFQQMKRIFLSANNWYWINKRLNLYYDIAFLARLERLKQWCDRNHVKRDDVCIVGSAVMELLGLRNCNNLNVVIKSCYDISDSFLDNGIELNRDYYCIEESGGFFNNDILIDDDEYHFVFDNVKFCNLEYVERYKKQRGEEKDLVDVAKISQWKSFVLNFDNQEMLQKRIQAELYRRGIIR